VALLKSLILIKVTAPKILTVMLKKFYSWSYFNAP